MGESIVPFRGHIKLELRSDLSPPGFLFRFYNEHPRLFDTRVSRAGNFIQSILKLKGFILVITYLFRSRVNAYLGHQTKVNQ